MSAQLTPNHKSSNLDDGWLNVEQFIDHALLIAWDTCHKIYLAMDQVEAQWFKDNYAPDVFVGTPEEMLAKLHEWFDQSCGLRFINAVYHDRTNPNAGYVSLIEQFADDGLEYDDEDEWDDDDQEDGDE